MHLLRDTLVSLGAATKEGYYVPFAPQMSTEVTKLPGGGYIEFILGRDHFDLYEGGLAERIAREMYQVARPQVSKPVRKAA